MSDSAIARAARDALSLEGRTAKESLTVKVETGVLTLGGTVSNLKAKRVAGRVAGSVVGVARVRNEVAVRPTDHQADREIAKNVATVLKWDPVVERHELEVAVRNGKAYLYGMVDSYYEMERATEVASAVPGVASVSNRLEVHSPPWKWRRDERIEEEIGQKLRWNWFVDESDIEVQVHDGVATLVGDVDSPLELRFAVESAFDGGARIVKSRLDLSGMAYMRVFHDRGDINLRSSGSG
jgi:osmotically-inducible protein OsmY